MACSELESRSHLSLIAGSALGLGLFAAIAMLGSMCYKKPLPPSHIAYVYLVDSASTSTKFRAVYDDGMVADCTRCLNLPPNGWQCDPKTCHEILPAYPGRVTECEKIANSSGQDLWFVKLAGGIEQYCKVCSNSDGGVINCPKEACTTLVEVGPPQSQEQP